MENVNAEEMTSKMSSSMDEKNGHFVEDSPTMDPRNQRKLTKPPATPEERKRSELTPKTKKNSQLRVNTMERYLEDQYEHWTHRRPPTTFGFSSLEHPLVKPKTLPTDLASLASRPSVGARRVSLTKEASDSEVEEKTLISKMINFSVHNGKGRVLGRDKRRRVVEKDGDANIQYKNISKRRRKYISDLYTTLVDSSWMESLLMFAASFYLTWLLFAVAYYVICYAHGDLEDLHLPSMQKNTSWKPCVLEIENFASCFLFSLETQHTIGYGSRQTTNECTSAMVVMSLQSIMGVLIQAFMVGIVFTKLSRPQSRSKTVVFSKNAVVCERNRRLCMIFRIGDMRHNSFIVNASLSVKVIRRRVTEEGEMYHEVSPIKIKPDSAEEPCIFLIWPLSVIHVIDEESPFYKLNAQDMANDKFELHVVLEGVTESTSSTFQARSSYLPHEILWGNRFEPMMLYRRDHNKYQVNFSAFHSTYEVDTPICSSYELDHYYKSSTSTACATSGPKISMPPLPHFQFNATASSSSSDSVVEDHEGAIP